MTFTFEMMNQEQAEDIAYNWHYDGEYSFYDMEADEDDLAEFLDSGTRGDSVFAVLKEDELIGFFSINKVGPDICDIGLGLRPDLTGKGMGLEFLNSGIDFVQSRFNPVKITLSVATFNQRAIKTYRRIGFKDIETFMQDTNGSTFEFLKMGFEC
ncbi:GNAT family N-acetyltransferase [Bacillus sp. AFS015802]|uniref:GNAT family N-acetyltransferase n=1 Tax=Bacillus sp. AFS015802 TaxID=2033486 RepID=UPI000BF5CCCD|nr:GNAT family N-acetyltransferase [Bacillus sp. AFS015802]PFA63052.1 GNAT family N-acetyltransferase [Bacillus sp. AFS015802]